MSVSGYEPQHQPFGNLSNKAPSRFFRSVSLFDIRDIELLEAPISSWSYENVKTMIGRKDADGGSTCVTRTETAG